MIMPGKNAKDAKLKKAGNAAAVSAFDKACARLNKAQKEAVDTIEGPVMVVAGPGTGKTQILTLRIANILLQTDTPASGILALTFTEAGQKAMRLKLRQFIGSRADEVAVHTYHSFASSVIADFPDHFPHLARARQLSDVESENLIREILREKKFVKLRPLGDPDLYVGKIGQTISDCRKEAWTPEIVREFAEKEIERVKNDPVSISTRGASKGKLKADAEKRIGKCERTILFAEVYELYEKRKRAERRIDFDDLIFELLETMEKDELLLRLLQEKYLYLLVDEHQDTNSAQNLLIRKIADFYDEPNLFVVGDEKQAIYRFQVASVQNFLHFQHAWPKMKTISLVENYRSHQGILDAVFPMIENNYLPGEHENLRVRLKAAVGDAPKPVTFALADDIETGENYLAAEIKKIVEKSPEMVAVITRTNREVERALEVLESAGITATAERGTDIFAHPIGNLYFKLLEFLADQSNTEALARTLAGGLWRLNFSKSADLIKKLRSGSLNEAEKEIPELIELKRAIANSGPIEFLVYAANLSGLAELASGDPLSAEVWNTIIDLAGDLAPSKGLEDPAELIKELLTFRQMAGKRSVKIFAGAPDAQVAIMTAHGSKGLEFDHVFLPYATEESWMRRGQGEFFVLPEMKDDEDETRDARRLFYVALTRAKKQATIIAGLADSMQRPLSPLRFIEELDSENLSRAVLPKSKNTASRNLRSSPEEKDLTESLEYARHVLSEKGLSVTALNHWSECSRKFFYKSILKLPEAPSGPSEKGNAMHEAIASVWLSKDKTAKGMTETLLRAIHGYFKHSLLPKLEKEVILEELTADAPEVTDALAEHFNQTGAVFAEKWVEAVFQAEFEGKPIELRLHGKLDAIVETKDKILVFDYKTKKKMSENEVKGETQNSDGGYFRQLIFYKLLLLNNPFYEGKEIEPALVFVKPDEKGRCPIVSLPIEKTDIERVKGEIGALIKNVWSGEILRGHCDESKCEFCRLRDISIFK